MHSSKFQQLKQKMDIILLKGLQRFFHFGFFHTADLRIFLPCTVKVRIAGAVVQAGQTPKSKKLFRKNNNFKRNSIASKVLFSGLFALPLVGAIRKGRHLVTKYHYTQRSDRVEGEGVWLIL